MNVLQDPLGVPVVLFTDPSGDLLGRMRSVAKPPDEGGRGVEGVHDGIGRVVQDRLLLQRPIEHVGTSGRAPPPPFAFHQSGPSKHAGGTGGRARRGALSHHHHHSRRDMMLMPFPLTFASTSARTGRGGLRLPDVDRHALDDRDDVGQKDHARAFEERPSRGAGGRPARLLTTHRKTPASRTDAENDLGENSRRVVSTPINGLSGRRSTQPYPARNIALPQQPGQSLFRRGPTRGALLGPTRRSGERDVVQ